MVKLVSILSGVILLVGCSAPTQDTGSPGPRIIEELDVTFAEGVRWEVVSEDLEIQELTAGERRSLFFELLSNDQRSRDLTDEQTIFISQVLQQVSDGHFGLGKEQSCSEATLAIGNLDSQAQASQLDYIANRLEILDSQIGHVNGILMEIDANVAAQSDDLAVQSSNIFLIANQLGVF